MQTNMKQALLFLGVVGALTPSITPRGFFKSFFDDFNVDVSFGPSIKMNVLDQDKAYVVEAEIPGMKKDKARQNIDVSVKGRKLSLTVKTSKEETKRDEQKDGEGNYLLKEIRTSSMSGEFHRTVLLPGHVKEDQVTAVYDEKRELLIITLPKRDEAPRKNPINIQVR